MEPKESFNRYCEYQEYLFRNEEWRCYGEKASKGSRVMIQEPFLIAEISRLIPYLGQRDVQFHPINMPHVKIGKVEVVGFVTSARETAENYEYTIEDGTGTIPVRYYKNFYVQRLQERRIIDQTYRDYAANIREHLYKFDENCPKQFIKNRPGFEYPDGTSINDMLILEHAWWKDVNQGLLGKKPERLDYVQLFGYIGFNFIYGRRPKDELTFNHLSAGDIYLRASRLRCIPEKTYNEKLLVWLNRNIPARYESEDVRLNEDRRH